MAAGVIVGSKRCVPGSARSPLPGVDSRDRPVGDLLPRGPGQPIRVRTFCLAQREPPGPRKDRLQVEIAGQGKSLG